MMQLTADVRYVTPTGDVVGLMSGGGEPRSGDVTVDISFDACPESRASQLIILSAFMLTGCPYFGLPKKGATNLWWDTGGEYTGFRNLVFAHGGQLSSVIRTQRTTSGIHMQLDVWGNALVSDIVDVGAPFQERFEPLGPGRLRGSFPISFVKADGTIVSALAQSEYVLKTFRTLPGPQFRNIILTAKRSGTSIHQRELITLFSDEHAAREHLKAAQSLATKNAQFDWAAAA